MPNKSTEANDQLRVNMLKAALSTKTWKPDVIKLDRYLSTKKAPMLKVLFTLQNRLTG
jgi:hypothetical protein